MTNITDAPQPAPILEVRGLSVGFAPGKNVLHDVSFDVRPGETLALVGESGSGKTLSCRAVLKLLPKAAQIRSGSILYRDATGEIEPLTLSPRALRAFRGDKVSMIFQQPMHAFSMMHTAGDQVGEVLRLHSDLSAREIKDTVLRTFETVGFTDPERVYGAYPFELSGGMRQRAMIAMATIGKPRLIIADEPTTALDVTTQAMVLGLLKKLQSETGAALILVTHDLGVVANMADQVAVMKKGRVVESGRADLILGSPWHSYTKRLIAAAPEIPTDPPVAAPETQPGPLLEMTNVSRSFVLRSKLPWSRPQTFAAVSDFNLTVPRGATVAIAGESGSGKTTCARIALGALPPDPGGSVIYRPRNAEPIAVHELTPQTRTAFQRQAQMVFQDPYSTLNPRMRIREALCEPMEIHGIGTPAERLARAEEVLGWVGLSGDMLGRYPHAFSGGQRQRLSIARALMIGPEFLVCDEPTSALDVSVQAQVLDLLAELQEKLGLSYLFISHDLAVIAQIADEVAVMRQGVIVEQGPPAMLFNNPQHPYTRALIAAQPEPDVQRPIDLAAVARGAGDPAEWPAAYRLTDNALPPLRAVEGPHRVRAHA
ncbi:ABC transporter ATP-binding protein [Pseudooceanicola nanhaiensis]|uniref:dipeptide ABC transporter ATP-binding protein n=1 Tax=Pseudooceanicola nanhaiensis TaxID=375761 RepID=UPI001CD1E89C|nr:ABC transporter ATP-binding protein [Pseudooceanicola nanhaiensis]MCA0919163.1 ABC transporter ATP-binding protein [Pseudooceanicola nanhaiensis]